MTDNFVTVYSNTQTNTSYFQAFLNKILFTFHFHRSIHRFKAYVKEERWEIGTAILLELSLWRVGENWGYEYHGSSHYATRLTGDMWVMSDVPRQRIKNQHWWFWRSENNTDDKWLRCKTVRCDFTSPYRKWQKSNAAIVLSDIKHTVLPSSRKIERHISLTIHV